MRLFYRSELEYLIDWIERSNRKPLIMQGARQVGKSTLVHLLAGKTSRHLLEIDFEKNPKYADLFKSQEPETILKLLAVQLNQSIDPNNSLLFLDEIQKTPEVLMSLRYFYEKMPSLPVIATGSLLDLALKEINFSFPVGRIEYFYLTPINFETFLLATKKEQQLDFIKQYTLHQEIPASIHHALLGLVKEYFIVGGLPAAVSDYVATGDFLNVDRTKKGLIIAYQDDFAKYALPPEQNRLRQIFNKVPRILGEKFKYTNINPEQKSTLLKKALDHLHLARVVHVVYHTDANGIPLGSEIKEKHFKTYFVDVGLVSSSVNLNILDFTEEQDFTLVNAGKIAEQFVAQELLQFRELYENPALYYWQREKKSSSAEIDFVIAHKNQVIPVEVKAGKSGTLKSLHYFVKEKNLPLGIRVCNQLPSLHDEASFRLLTFPFYLIGQLKRLLENI